MSPKRLLLYVITSWCILALCWISYHCHKIRGSSSGSDRSHARLVGKEKCTKLLRDYRDILRIMQERGAHEREQEGYKSELKICVDKSAPLMIQPNTSSSEDGGQQKLIDTKLVIREAHPRPHCVKQVKIWGTEHLQRGIEPCPGLACGINLVIDANYETLKDSDAVLLLPRTPWNWTRILSHKHKGQKFIFYSHESPLNTQKGVLPPKDYLYSAYDYIMSYRFRESHLYASFAYYDTSKPSISSNETRNWAAGRKRQVAWLSSNCKSIYLHWNRTGFVKELSKYLDVGMYGKCGEQGACPPRVDDFSETCNGVLRQFKFYLALENCACRDYITEKLWNNAFKNDLVPIVFGPTRADYEAVVPPDSFIHVEDFETIQDLADFVTILDQNDHLYNKFFEWKKQGSVEVTNESWLFMPQNMCQVVSRLLDDEKAARTGKINKPILPNWKEWWPQSCRNISGFPIKIRR
ncbi:3-galactosyl-N-acetylglucosaminide 4-alpha-L-fucosyltransferase FUT3-like [Lytechinus variegatus]|uniref:3-galactosyl-N-acetylglucosaminide 4-alpha-L-fucosyltransferase FUT3-like n=1 Tax=Lytechinus variegatus TaxID=7654 RepID=UPI001BB253E0|nr:3-galactosyl-N-acetylglucosaminide 4-alpha-L-fucosyltransferase FUT3-like [Lytechinus variegatus]